MAHYATGTVVRIYADTEGCYISLRYPDTTPKPKDGYFRLLKSHQNYSSLYSLAVVAAVNRYNLSIRTNGEIDPNEHGSVRYMVVDW